MGRIRRFRNVFSGSHCFRRPRNFGPRVCWRSPAFATASLVLQPPTLSYPTLPRVTLLHPSLPTSRAGEPASPPLPRPRLAYSALLISSRYPPPDLALTSPCLPRSPARDPTAAPSILLTTSSLTELSPYSVSSCFSSASSSRASFLPLPPFLSFSLAHAGPLSR